MYSKIIIIKKLKGVFICLEEKIMKLFFLPFIFGSRDLVGKVITKIMIDTISQINIRVMIHIYIYIYIYIHIYMCSPSFYHNNSFVKTHALRHTM